MATLRFVLSFSSISVLSACESFVFPQFAYECFWSHMWSTSSVISESSLRKIMTDWSTCSYESINMERYVTTIFFRIQRNLEEKNYLFKNSCPEEIILPGMWETWVWSLGQEDPWRRKWQPTPVLLPGESHGGRSLVGDSLWGRKELDTTERLHFLSF